MKTLIVKCKHCAHFSLKKKPYSHPIMGDCAKNIAEDVYGTDPRLCETFESKKPYKFNEEKI